MKNLYLDEITKDLSLNDKNDLRITQNKTEFVSQKIENKLSFFLGEWWLNVDLGLPYFQSIFKKNPDLNLINSLYIAEINSIDEIEEILEFETTFDTALRIFNVNFKVKISTDEIIQNTLSILA